MKVKVGDYLFCIFEEPGYYGRIFLVTRLGSCFALVDWLEPEGLVRRSGEVDFSVKGLRNTRPATDLEVVSAKLRGL